MSKTAQQKFDARMQKRSEGSKTAKQALKEEQHRAAFLDEQLNVLRGEFTGAIQTLWHAIRKLPDHELRISVKDQAQIATDDMILERNIDPVTNEIIMQAVLKGDN